MYPEEIHTPVALAGETFLNQQEGGGARVSLAAYLLLAGPLFVQGVTEDQSQEVIPHVEELRTVGVRREVLRRVPPRVYAFSAFEPGVNLTPRELANLVVEANESGNPDIAARAVACGTRSTDELIRICALGSAVEFFEPRTLDLPGQVAWFLSNARETQTFVLLWTLFGRLTSHTVPATLGPAIAGNIAGPGLIAVHGTVLPLSQTAHPVWSVPQRGPLFNHLKRLRPDIYSQPDYFRWEGGYTDYAREVAIQNLLDWIGRRQLIGTDVVAHSHGCNVVMGGASKGASYRKLILMNCPVHWKKYSLPAAAATGDVISIRIKFDIVILMDRGGQRFPSKTISEHILPFWYTGHSVATSPATWQQEKLDSYL